MFGELVVVDDVPGAFRQLVVEAFKARTEETFAFALCGGSTGHACYERLARDVGDAIDWWDVDFYWGDERCVPPDDPDSNLRMCRETLLEKVGAANAVYPMSCEEGPDTYQSRIEMVGNFDLVHLGMGPDGHTASLFPGSEALDAEPGRLVAFNTDPHGRNPHRRMTFTLEGLSRAKLILLTLMGAEKAPALELVRDGADLPVARIRPQRLVWLVDHDAAPWA